MPTYRGSGTPNTGSIAVTKAEDVVNTPSGSVVATDVQAAITELDTEKLPKTGGVITGDLDLGGNFHLTNGNHMDVGEAGTEDAGIDVNGTVYDPKLRVNDIGTANPAQVVFHRHSTTLQPLLLGARSNSETETHAAITANQGVFSILGAGYTGTHYDLFGSINISASASGTISSTSSPAKMTFDVSPDGSNSPATALTIESDKSATFAGNIAVSGTVDGRDVATDGTKLDGIDTAGNAKAWVNFNGTGTVAINDSFNVSSITDNGVGDYTINFTNAMSNTNYAFFGTYFSTSATLSNGSDRLCSEITDTPRTTSLIRVRTTTSNASANAAVEDGAGVQASIFAN